MLKARMGNKLILGLSEINIQKLMMNYPIYFTGDVLDFPNKEFVIGYSETIDLPVELPSELKKILEEKTDKFTKIFQVKLTRNSVKNIKTGNILVLDGEALRVNDFEIVIFYSKTEEDMRKYLKESGLITPKTKEIKPAAH